MEKSDWYWLVLYAVAEESRAAAASQSTLMVREQTRVTRESLANELDLASIRAALSLSGSLQLRKVCHYGLVPFWKRHDFEQAAIRKERLN